MGSFAQLLTLISLILIGKTYDGNKIDRSIRINKNKKYKKLNTFLLVLLFISLPLTFNLFPFNTLIILVFYTLLFPLFYLVNNWTKITREIYNLLTISQLFLMYYISLKPVEVLKEICHYIGFGFIKGTSRYCCDDNGSSGTRDYFYVNSGNGKLDNLLDNYFNYVLIVISILLIYYIISIDKKIRQKVREIDSSDSEIN